MPFNEDRILLNLSDSELEDLVKKWIATLEDEYVGFERPSASADMGRDAVGFLTKFRYDGEWHNYQCKHLKKPVGEDSFVLELGKIFHYACAGEFTIPTKYIFIAPNSCVRDVRKVIDRPSLIGPFLIKNWDRYCLERISKAPCPLTDDIREAINAYGFENVELWKATEFVERPNVRAVLHEHVDIDPGEAPQLRNSDVPCSVSEEEREYVTQLVKVFCADSGQSFKDHEDIALDSLYGPQMTTARRRYLERKAFRRHFRDNMPSRQIDNVDRDVHESIVDKYHAMNSEPVYKRMCDLMTSAAFAEITGTLGRHHRVSANVKQGVCHHYANIGELPWV